MMTGTLLPLALTAIVAFAVAYQTARKNPARARGCLGATFVSLAGALIVGTLMGEVRMGWTGAVLWVLAGMGAVSAGILLGKTRG